MQAKPSFTTCFMVTSFHGGRCIISSMCPLFLVNVQGDKKIEHLRGYERLNLHDARDINFYTLYKLSHEEGMVKELTFIGVATTSGASGESTLTAKLSCMKRLSTIDSSLGTTL